MTLYHEATNDSVKEILAHGLKRTSRGEKGDASDIIKTDQYLDERRPGTLRQKGLSRDDNIYAFIGTESSLIDITNGATISLKEYPRQDSALLRLSIDESACYISDLDRYDAIKAAISNHETATLEELATAYWASVTPLHQFSLGDVSRPEVMITQDIEPRHLALVP